MIASCTCIIRFTSVMEAEGSVTGINRRLPSSSGGINSDPILISIGTAINRATIFIAIVVFRHFNTQRITGAYRLLRTRVIGFSFSLRNFPRVSMVINIGTSVMAIIAEPARTNVLVKARGRKSFPSCPSNKKTGRKDTTMIATE